MEVFLIKDELIDNKSTEKHIKNLEKEFLIREHGGYFSGLFCEWLKIAFKSFFQKDNFNSGCSYIFKPEKIRNLYGDEYSGFIEFGIRDRVPVNIFCRGVLFKMLSNLCFMKFSPSLAVYNFYSIKNKGYDLECVSYAADHPYILSFLLASKPKIKIYYQHGYYPDKFYHQFSFFDVGYTAFNDSHVYLKEKGLNVKFTELPSFSSPLKKKFCLVAVPYFGNPKKVPSARLYAITKKVIDKCILEFGEGNVAIRFHPKERPLNWWVIKIKRIGLKEYNFEVPLLLKEVSDIVFVLDSTLRYEAEKSGVKTKIFNFSRGDLE